MKLPFLLALALPAPLAAQDAPALPAPACQAQDADLPGPLSAWRRPTAAGTVLRPGQAVQLTLRPVVGATTIVPPHASHDGGTQTVGQIALEIGSAGTYGVALESGAWVDLLQDSRSLPSISHGHGPACSTIRKIVDFQLAPGRYQLQISGTTAAGIRLLVIPR